MPCDLDLYEDIDNLEEENEALRALLFEGAAIWKPGHPPSSLTWQCDLAEWLAWLEKVEALR